MLADRTPRLTVYLYQAALGTYEEDTPLDPSWPFVYMLVAFAPATTQ